MFTVKPTFFDDFICKADKCTDTCCAGWEIDIDNETVCKYKSVEGDFGKSLYEGISLVDDVYSFRLKENERCWFLADNGQCDIYSNLGKDSLCEICREHPRFYNCYDDAEESGFGLCCEKVCELLFADDEPFSVVTEGELPDDEYSEFFSVRNDCFEIFTDGNNSLQNNIKELLNFAADVQNDFFGVDYSVSGAFNKYELFEDVLNLYKQTEAINEDWRILISEIQENLAGIISVSEKNDFIKTEYEKLLCYILYRHLIEAAVDGNFVGGVSFSVAAIIFIHILDCLSVLKNKVFTDEDRINNVKLWSKQIEYSHENTEMLKDESIDLFFI